MTTLARLFLGITFACAAAQIAAAAGTVELEVLTERGFPAEATHDWLNLLKKSGATNIRIRPGQLDEKPDVQTRGTEKAPVYHVTAVLSAGGTFNVPGKRFGLQHGKQLGDYFKELAEQGPGGAKKIVTVAFGLSEAQFAKLSDDLKTRVGFTTKGLTTNEAVARLAAPLAHRLTVDESAKAALAEGEKVLDELSGISTGTALAAALRPAGLILLPRVRDGTVELVVTSSKGAKELWPIGWSPEQAAGKIVPDLAATTNVEIEDTAVLDALGAVAKRLQTPVLFDHNNIARKGIIVEEARVTLPAERVIYATVLRKVLYQAQLKYELRVDEAGKPLLWIVPLRQ